MPPMMSAGACGRAKRRPNTVNFVSESSPAMNLSIQDHDLCFNEDALGVAPTVARIVRCAPPPISNREAPEFPGGSLHQQHQ